MLGRADIWNGCKPTVFSFTPQLLGTPTQGRRGLRKGL